MKKIVLLILMISSAVLAKAQSGYRQVPDSLFSAILQQNRRLEIFIPDGYDTLKTGLPVIYVLDAEGRDQHIVPTIRFLNQNNKMPQALIVGVKNIDRNHDFLSDSTKGAPTGGGADKFMSFFEKELFDYIDRHYRTEPYRVLIGHSYGGLFAAYALLKKPDLFDAFIAMDPSFWYNNNKILEYAADAFKQQRNWERILFITAREGEGMVEMGIPQVEKYLSSSAPPELRWKIAAYPFEDHGSVTFKSAYDGLRYIFDSGGSVKVMPQSGIIPDGATFTVYPQATNPDLRYTTDGTEPVIGSQVCSQKLTLTGPCTLTIRDVAKKYKNYPSVSASFRGGDYLENKVPPAGLKPGLKYSLYAGAFDSMPPLRKSRALKTGVSQSIDPEVAGGRDSFALRFDGYLLVKEQSLYDLWIVSDANAAVYINGIPVLRSTGPQAEGSPEVVILPLKAGYYPIVVTCYGKKGCRALKVGLLKEGEQPDPAPLKTEDLFHQEKK